MSFKSSLGDAFRSAFSESLFVNKYRHENAQTWPELVDTLVEEVCREHLSRDEKWQLKSHMRDMKFIPGGRYLYYCLEGSVPVLKKDYTWDKAENIKIGDELVGFDEDLKGKPTYKYTKVLNVKRITKPRYLVKTTLGDIIVSNCHQFVARKGKNNKHPNEKTKWYRADELCPGNLIYYSKAPWKVDTSFDAGWLSGIMDGEGTVSKGSISISQKPGLVLDNICRILDEKNILYYVTNRYDDVSTVHIRGRWESIKCLGIFRPIRLMHNWYLKDLGSFWSRIEKPAEVISSEYLDEGEVFAIETDTHTLISNGFLSHNCGRIRRYYNNCLSGNTEFLTDQGFKKLEDVVDTTVSVLSPISGKFEKASVKCFDTQDLHKITFSNVRGKSKKTWIRYATAHHRWPLTNGEITNSLKVGDVVKANIQPIISSPERSAGFIHGMFFADGNLHILKSGFGHQLRLCGDKKEYLKYFDLEDYTVTYPEFANGDPCIYINSARNLKELPLNDNLEYIAGFLDGWSRLDGYFGATSFQLHSINRDAIEFFEYYANLLGYIVTGNIISIDTPSNFGSRDNTLYRVNFTYGFNFPGFKVTNIEYFSREKAYCVVEPKYNQFVLADGMSTGNCYLLKCLEDSREDWADLSWKAERCLTVGGGIGSDYSVYRPRNSYLHGTGGVASGPVSKMRMINEIGREVIQGGSRRSAIYASLNWKHEDIQEFLHAKDWQSLKIAGTSSTFADARKEDFNFPCPLDMTNISVNYDTEWLLNYWNTKELGKVFLENCRQAMKTGEPGFSFNFFNRENETLRNACTEVVSEDDSDVCNLGSINLARVSSISEFSDVVELATKFLLCGTLVAELPYDRVYQVRNKNRRLGLGIMGLHEWLLQRGYRYEVPEELHHWMALYKGISRNIASIFSSELSVSNPVACRAIAPTGSIGILASTTTGIEPVYAVAIKRRYLKNNNWKYQYVVDEIAKGFIAQGYNPEKIESSVDLAADYKRRLSVQANIQDYVDMSISSTINMPAWGTELNNEDKLIDFAQTLSSYAHRLRGFTVYPDGARGGQPLVSVPYTEAAAKLGVELEENTEHFDVCDITGKGGYCGA